MITIIKYRLKCFLKNKSLVFWTLLFPIMLATIFNVVLKDVQTLIPLETIDVAVIKGENQTLAGLVETLADKESENYILNVTYTDQKEANALLNDNKVSAILYLDNEPSIKALTYGYDQTILKSIINTYTRVYSQVDNMANSNPMILQDLVIEELFENDLQVTDKESLGSKSDMNNLYFYTIIAMVCLYGMLWGVRICSDTQATQSTQAARVNISPLSKIKMLSIDFVIGYIIIVCEILIAIAYLHFVLDIVFANELLLIIGVVLSGTFASLSLGILFGSLLKGEMESKVGIVSAFTVLSNFFAGMMSTTIPYLVDQYIPFLRYINPADLISRSFSMLNYYQDFTPIYTNIAILSGMGVLFLIAVYVRVGRSSYASL